MPRLRRILQLSFLFLCLHCGQPTPQFGTESSKISVTNAPGTTIQVSQISDDSDKQTPCLTYRISLTDASHQPAAHPGPAPLSIQIAGVPNSVLFMKSQSDCRDPLPEGTLSLPARGSFVTFQVLASGLPPHTSHTLTATAAGITTPFILPLTFPWGVGPPPPLTQLVLTRANGIGAVQMGKCLPLTLSIASRLSTVELMLFLRPLAVDVVDSLKGSFYFGATCTGESTNRFLIPAGQSSISLSYINHDTFDDTARLTAAPANLFELGVPLPAFLNFYIDFSIDGVWTAGFPGAIPFFRFEFGPGTGVIVTNVHNGRRATGTFRLVLNGKNKTARISFAGFRDFPFPRIYFTPEVTVRVNRSNDLSILSPPFPPDAECMFVFTVFCLNSRQVMKK